MTPLPTYAESLIDVNTIGSSAVPTAFSFPLTYITLEGLTLFTITPGSTVNVTPLGIVILLFKMYGLLANVQVVFSLITPCSHVVTVTGLLYKDTLPSVFIAFTVYEYVVFDLNSLSEYLFIPGAPILTLSRYTS